MLYLLDCKVCGQVLYVGKAKKKQKTKQNKTKQKTKNKKKIQQLPNHYSLSIS